MSWNNWFHTNLRWPLDCTRRTWRISRTSKSSFSRPPEFWPCRNGISLSGLSLISQKNIRQRAETHLPQALPCGSGRNSPLWKRPAPAQGVESPQIPCWKKNLNSLFERIFPPSKKDMPFWELPKNHETSSQKEQHKSPKHIQNKPFQNFHPTILDTNKK